MADDYSLHCLKRKVLSNRRGRIMKIWLDSDGKGQGNYFAVVDEVTIDKDGKPVYARPRNNEKNSVSDTSEEDALLLKFISEISHKIDLIIEYLDQEEELVEEVAEEEPVEEVAEEEPVEEVFEEEPVEEVAEEEAMADASAPTNNVINNIIINNVIVNNANNHDEVALAEMPAIDSDVNVAAAVVVEGPTAVKRSPNFAEKMMAADELLQDRYDDLKNYALRFRKLKSRISRKFDSINQGRLQFVKLSLAGKTLKLYLNMDASTVDPKYHCKDVSDKKTYVTVPTLLRIKSGRAVKYAKILIDQCAEQFGMLERRTPLIVDAMALIEESLNEKETPETDVADEVEVMDESAATEVNE